jgi:CPA2 family monovalent cation:H+ antiporter-2
MEYEFLKSLVIVFGVSALVVFLLYKLKIPSLVGFLVAGIIIGPYGVGIIKDAHSVEMLAEIAHHCFISYCSLSCKQKH